MCRNEQVCKKLKTKHGLYFAKGKEHIKQHRLREPDKSKYRIYNAVKDEIGNLANWAAVTNPAGGKRYRDSFQVQGTDW